MIPDNIFETTPITPWEQAKTMLPRMGILFCSGEYFVSKRIRALTESIMSHVGLVYWSEDFDCWMVFEVVESQGGRIISLEKYLTDYADGKPYNGKILVARLTADIRFFGHIEDFATKDLPCYAKYLGIEYDSGDLKTILLRLNGIPVDIQPDSHLICSEFLDIFLGRLGYKVEFDRELLPFPLPRDFAAAPEIEVVCRLQ